MNPPKPTQLHGLEVVDRFLGLGADASHVIFGEVDFRAEARRQFKMT
jgi:hypothetical protein